MVSCVFRGRISEAPLSIAWKHPMIIPKSHHVATLLISHFHVASAHAGQERVLARLREQFWIPRTRSTVRSSIRTCFGCRNRQAGRMTQIMAGLPKMRVSPYEPPFTRTGMDYFGPMLVKRRRYGVKRWGALFIC